MSDTDSYMQSVQFSNLSYNINNWHEQILTCIHIEIVCKYTLLLNFICIMHKKVTNLNSNIQWVHFSCFVRNNIGKYYCQMCRIMQKMSKICMNVHVKHNFKVTCHKNGTIGFSINSTPHGYQVKKFVCFFISKYSISNIK